MSSKEIRLTDANALQRKICRAKCGCEYEDCVNEGDCEFDFFIFHAPTIDPESLRPHGKWEISSDGYYPYCSECGEEPKGGNMTKFCPNCGVKMERAANENQSN